ncbi:sodium:solute symporter family transporter [Nitrincola sp.]|uniref:sodium:solute symporter family transporter n=1 Tax=Nitrincola sp. TaxID=1926584 RepID=UPI003A95990C
MRTDLFIFLLVGATATFYLLVMVSSRSGSGRDFYTLSGSSTPLASGMASAADWLCAATFLGLFGLFSVNPLDSQLILTGWLAGLVLMGLWVAPAQFHSGKLCLSGYLGAGYNSRLVGYLALIIVVLISTLLLALQLRGMSLIFSRHLQLSVQAGVIISMFLLLFYVVLGSMKAMTQVQMLQYCILFCALMIPSVYLAGKFDERFGVLFSRSFFSGSGFEFQLSLDSLRQQLGFTSNLPSRDTVDVVFLLLSLMAGVAVLPHLLLRYQSVKKTADISQSTVWMLVFLGLIYSSMPLIASMGELRLIQSVNGEFNEGTAYSRMPDWFYAWEQNKQLAWYDHTQDGKVQYAAGSPFEGSMPLYNDKTGLSGEPLILNPAAGIYEPLQQRFPSELYVAEELRLFLIPEVSAMPVWVVGILSVGIVAAILSSASVLMISAAHSAAVQLLSKRLTQRAELKLARLVAVCMLLMAGLLALILPGTLIELMNRIIALAAATLFAPTLLLIFRPGLHPYAVFTGILAGFTSYLAYTLVFDLSLMQMGQTSLSTILSPEAFGACAMLLNLGVTLLMTVFFKVAVLPVKQ